MNDPHAAEPPPAARRARRWPLRLLAGLAGLALTLALAAGGAVLWLRGRMTSSLPDLAAGASVAGLAAPVTVTRDRLGIPTLAGSSRQDLAFATGFVHAQDRFFQMDLLRRRSAGELAELLGSHALANDRAMRIHLFRAHARRLLRRSPPAVRALLEAYARGANAGLAALHASPFEYLVLHAQPRRWAPEDSYLVLYSMFAQLEDVNASVEAMEASMNDLLPRPVVDFLLPPGTEWDAPIEGGPLAGAAAPGPEVFDLRRRRAAWLAMPPPRTAPEAARRPAAAGAGSNSWAVSGARGAAGAALLANELHLEIGVPDLWYRAALSWPVAGRTWRVTGVTLPGAPAIVVGSNGHVAWGLTNSVLDTSDLVLLDVTPAGDRYRTPDGTLPFERHAERLRVKWGEDRRLVFDWSRWGPVVGGDARGRRRAVHAVADDDGAVDFTSLELETAPDVPAALDVARRSGVPALNFLAADAAGHIGWTVMGRLPRRVGFDGRWPVSWADGQRRWDGLLAPGQVPAVIDPPSGRLWTANNRVVSGDALARLGNAHYILGARARQIRDDLAAVERATVEDMRRIQLDDRAVFLGRWHDLLLRLLDPEAIAADPRRGELRRLVAAWGGRAGIDSAGYRLVRIFRLRLATAVFHAFTAECEKAVPDFDFLDNFDQHEGPLWQLVTRQPPHLLDPRYRTWREQLLAAVDEVIALYAPLGPLRERTWGERNTADIRHLLSPMLPGLGGLLDMPKVPLPGADYMPRVQDPSSGSTLRMVVAPGREAEGILQLPGGQSGDPLSPHYRDQFASWARGDAAAFLPGPAVHTLRLLPAAPGVPAAPGMRRPALAAAGSRVAPAAEVRR